MKVRSGFVSNSSSSSFIIAIRSNVTDEDINAFVEKATENIKNFIEDMDYKSDCVDEIVEETKQELRNEIMFALMDSSGLLLENWKVFANEYSNEDGDYYAFMYDCAEDLSTELFKFKRAGYQYENS